MRKYIPSISENNQLKENYLAQANALIWKTEKGKINPHLNVEEVKNSFASLKESLQKLDNSLGTGKENVLPLSLKADSALKGLSKALEGELFSRIDDAIDEIALPWICGRKRFLAAWPLWTQMKGWKGKNLLGRRPAWKKDLAR